MSYEQNIRLRTTANCVLKEVGFDEYYAVKKLRAIAREDVEILNVVVAFYLNHVAADLGLKMDSKSLEPQPIDAPAAKPKRKPAMAKRGLEARAAIQSTIAKGLLDGRFRDRGLSPATIGALIDSGVDFPERLLFMDEKAVEALPGIGPAKLREIKDYVLSMREVPE